MRKVFTLFVVGLLVILNILFVTDSATLVDTREYQVYLTTKVNPKKLAKGTGIIVIESDDYSKSEIKAIKAKGYKVLGYISVGSLEKGRVWYKKYRKYRLKKMDDWPEYYVDVTQHQWREFIIARAKYLRKKGFDGFWLDNIDIYSEYKSPKMYAAIKSVLLKIKAMGLYVMLNGGSEWIDDSMDRHLKLSTCMNGYTQEEVFSRITDYSGKGKFGRQKPSESKYYKWAIKKVKKRGVECYCLEYTRSRRLKRKIHDWCKKYKVGYYISEDVDL